MMYHPYVLKWQRKRRMVNTLLFWMPVFCLSFLIVYLVYFLYAVLS